MKAKQYYIIKAKDDVVLEGGIYQGNALSVESEEDNEPIDQNNDNAADANAQPIEEEEEEKKEEEEKEEVDLTDEQIDERMTSAWDAPSVTRTHRARTEKSMNPQWDNPASKDILGRLNLHGKKVVFN